MRYLAQFSEAPRARTHSFWQDALNTEAWLASEGKHVAERQLTMKARGVRALTPWLPFQSQPLAIDAWLDPMDIAVTWRYLVQFLAQMGPERVWIPCGDDSWVGWTGQQLTIRAARESWLWALVEDVWDPASWTSVEEREWWSEGRIQHARRLPWATSEQRSWMTGWEEWTLSREPGTNDAVALTKLWSGLAERLGARPIRVKWLQEQASDEEKILGIRARYVSCDLIVQGDDRHWLDGLDATPEPFRIRTQATWRVPNWSEGWSTTMTLRRVQRGSRLEATYSPDGPLSPRGWRALQRERRQIPILQMRPLSSEMASPSRWQALADEAQSHHDREQLSGFLQSCAWPKLTDPVSRLRLSDRWTIWRWGSQTGLWVLRSTSGLEVHIEWPTTTHPGHLGVSVAGAPPIAMSEWVRQSGFKRLSHDTRYWGNWVVRVLLPMLEVFEAERLADR